MHQKEQEHNRHNQHPIRQRLSATFLPSLQMFRCLHKLSTYVLRRKFLRRKQPQLSFRPLVYLLQFFLPRVIIDVIMMETSRFPYRKHSHTLYIICIIRFTTIYHKYHKSSRCCFGTIFLSVFFSSCSFFLLLHPKMSSLFIGRI